MKKQTTAFVLALLLGILPVSAPVRADGFWDNLAGTASGLVDKAKDMTSDAVDTVAGKAKDIAGTVSEAAGSAAETAKDWAGTAKKAAEEKAAELGEKIEEATSRPQVDYEAAPDLPEGVTVLPGKIFFFDQKGRYAFSEEEKALADGGTNPLGTFYLAGSLTHDAEVDGNPVFLAEKGEITFHYCYGNGFLAAADEEWHLAEDGGKTVDSIKLSKKIGSGAIILQTSVDGQSWITEKEESDVFMTEPVQDLPLYTSKPLQLMNGCYYRVIVAYQLERLVDSKKILVVNKNTNEYMQAAEVYEFFLTSPEAENEKASASNRMALGQKYRMKTDSGFFTELPLEAKDPHFGWELGNFFVTGFTRSMENKDGTPVFLKNPGDRVTLWFRLQQDISQLDGNPELSIAEDKDGYDKRFEVKKTNFKHGALVIRNTDHENVVHEPIVYTDFLAATARLGADTKIVLFEEGDYEVHLNYVIKKASRQVKGIEILPEYSDYQISFRFSIRNGNCMVYPFDVQTGSELADQASTENGFKLDMARSRYLEIGVKRSTLNAATGSLDERFNRPAADGESYLEEGVYTFTVKNRYTEETTTKTIYVGGSDTVKAYQEAAGNALP